jgi:hypothetical protein
MINRIICFFDKLEDRIRILLSHHPIPYAFIGGIGVILFWRGVWETADLFPWFTAPLSIVVGLIILLLTGLLVSFFIGDSIILSGFKREKKLAEKTESEVRSEKDTMQYVVAELRTIDEDLKKLQEKVDEKS